MLINLTIFDDFTLIKLILFILLILNRMKMWVIENLTIHNLIDILIGSGVNLFNSLLIVILNTLIHYLLNFICPPILFHLILIINILNNVFLKSDHETCFMNLIENSIITLDIDIILIIIIKENLLSNEITRMNIT
jgi:hypothetical protein